MTAIQEQQARQFSPEVNKFLDKVAEQKEVTAKIKSEAKKLGLTKQQLKEQIEQRKNIKMVLGISSAIGLVPPAANKLFHYMFG